MELHTLTAALSYALLSEPNVFRHSTAIGKLMLYDFCLPFSVFIACSCLTCESSESDAICVNCIRTCHRGHHVQFVRHDRYTCGSEEGEEGGGVRRGGVGREEEKEGRKGVRRREIERGRRERESGEKKGGREAEGGWRKKGGRRGKERKGREREL